jgi:TolB-like protein
VLGFKNLSGQAREAWLSAALSDWLMTELTAGEHVRAIPAESVARMKMELVLPDVDSLSRDSLMRIRKNLGTDYVVVGSYATLAAKTEGQIRLDLRLQDTRSGETIGAISEVGTEEHLLDLVSRAGEDLRKKLGVRAVTSEEAAEVAIALPTKSETAKLYSEGLVRLRAFDALKARDLLQRNLVMTKTPRPRRRMLLIFLPTCPGRNTFSLKGVIKRPLGTGTRLPKSTAPCSSFFLTILTMDSRWPMRSIGPTSGRIPWPQSTRCIGCPRRSERTRESTWQNRTPHGRWETQPDRNRLWPGP